ncbi:hypothetical protein BDN72DRAFT_850815, partial [Pluteus cervinus]
DLHYGPPAPVACYAPVYAYTYDVCSEALPALHLRIYDIDASRRSFCSKRSSWHSNSYSPPPLRLPVSVLCFFPPFSLSFFKFLYMHHLPISLSITLSPSYYYHQSLSVLHFHSTKHYAHPLHGYITFSQLFETNPVLSNSVYLVRHLLFPLWSLASASR